METLKKKCEDCVDEWYLPCEKEFQRLEELKKKDEEPKKRRLRE